MGKYITTLILLAGLLSGLFSYASVQDEPVLTATLDSRTPATQNIQTNAQNVNVAWITLTASVMDVNLNGIFLGTDVSGGLSNFTNIYVYDYTANDTLVGTYPRLGDINPNFISLGGNVIIGVGQSRTYRINVSLASSATGNIRVGFSGFTSSILTLPTLIGIPIYGNAMTLPGATPTPTLSPTPTPAITPTPTPTSRPTPASQGFVSLAALNLAEGDTISAIGSTDPDIYIANQYGYKRLFLNPIIFNFYGHLGGFAKVKNVTPTTRDVMVTSGLFRNCETNDQRVFGVEVTGEDAGVLHWINTSGTQAVQDDPDFFKKVFCINTNEFNWYPKGSDYTSVNQTPNYSR